jgi:hypothetical protein
MTTEYRFHWWKSSGRPEAIPAVTLQAESREQGAALALRHFIEHGFDITAPAGHLDITDADGTRHMLLVEEVVDWLKTPAQSDFVHREHLEPLL